MSRLHLLAVGGLLVAAVTACGSAQTQGGASTSASSTSPTASDTAPGTAKTVCLSNTLRALFPGDEGVTSWRCQEVGGTYYAAGIVSGNGAESTFFAKNTNGAWAKADEQQVCAVEGLDQVSQYCNGGRPDEKNVALPLATPPAASATPAATTSPSATQS